jgi:hypothetical protein
LRNPNPTERVESHMSKLRGVELSFSLDVLWSCKEELEKAKYPLFLDELILIIKKLAIYIIRFEREMVKDLKKSK